MKRRMWNLNLAVVVAAVMATMTGCATTRPVPASSQTALVGRGAANVSEEPTVQLIAGRADGAKRRDESHPDFQRANAVINPALTQEETLENQARTRREAPICPKHAPGCGWPALPSR
jgi:hypothetical protein